MADSLGRQIIGASFDFVSDALAQVEAREAGEWTEGHAQALEEDRVRLRALAARADAAERLAKAADAYSAACLLFDENDHPDVTAHYRESTDEYDNALAGWRASIAQGVGDA